LIRLSTPEDTPEIKRLALAQYLRTPWSQDGKFANVQAFHVCERQGHIAACCGFLQYHHTLWILHVWAEDGFSGRRAAVALMKDLKLMADASGLVLCFTVDQSNIGLQTAVEEHGCEPSFDEEPGAVAYRRKAVVWAAQA
jgi:N-acetylglutamate synthase-like GNAT family acetyltransferase